MSAEPQPTLAPVRELFRAVTRAAVPASAGLDDEGWARAEALVDAALADRPGSVRRQVTIFFRIVDVLSVLRFGRGLQGVESAQARTLLGWLERSPLLLLRRGVWGVRTLAFMGFYGQGATRKQIGYAASPGGWESRGTNQGPWPERRGAAPPEAGALVTPETPGSDHE